MPPVRRQNAHFLGNHSLVDCISNEGGNRQWKILSRDNLISEGDSSLLICNLRARCNGLDARPKLSVEVDQALGRSVVSLKWQLLDGFQSELLGDFLIRFRERAKRLID